MSPALVRPAILIVSAPGRPVVDSLQLLAQVVPDPVRRAVRVVLAVLLRPVIPAAQQVRLAV